MHSATKTIAPSEKPSSRVNAFWNAASWSPSSCCRYLSPMPDCASQVSVIAAGYGCRFRGPSAE